MAGRPPTFDHQQKKPLERRVRVYLDDEPIDALRVARDDLTDAETDADAAYDRRLALVRAANPPASELLTIEAGLHRDREEALAPYREKVDSAERAVLAASREFVFRSPQIERDGETIRGNRAFQEIVSEHPPTDEDHDQVRKATGRPEALASWNRTTFAPALVAATCVDPVLSDEQAQEMFADWNDAEVDELLAAALTVSQSARQVDLGKASRAANKRG